MKRLPFALAALAAFLSFSGDCLAHRVNVFAYVDGDEIQVECGFSRSQKVRNGKLLVTDLETGDTVLEGVTDAQGSFRFRPPDDFLTTGHGLNIRLFAGEGHQDDWKIPPEELRTLSPVPSVSVTKPETDPQTTSAPASKPPSSARNAEPGRSTPLSALDSAEIEAIMDKVVEAKLAPIRQTLARQQERGPDWREIIGGIGWIVGLLGFIVYWKHRR